MQSSDFFKIFLSPSFKSAEEVRRKRRRSGAYCGGAGMPLGFPCERGSSAAAITGRRRVRHAWGGGMMRWRSVWMGAGGSGVFSLRCRIGRSAKAMRRCALRRCSCGSARCRQTASEAGRIVFSRDYALWISRLRGGGADPSAPEIERASVQRSCGNAFRGGDSFPVCRRGTSLPPGRTRFGLLVFLLFFVARKLN